MNISIVPMKSNSDIDGKGYVHFRSWHETYTGLVSPEYMNNITAERCRDIAHKWPDNILVAKDGDRVVGFVGYGSYRDDSLADTGEVFALYVLQEYHGQRVGYRLMNAALERLGEYSRIALWVMKSNDRAISFYQRYGFRFDGTESTLDLGGPVTELRMVYHRQPARPEAIDTEEII